MTDPAAKISSVTRIVFTGTHRPKPGDQEKVEASLARLQADFADVDEFISGAAHNVDTVAALAAMRLFPKAKHTICVPAAGHNSKFVKDCLAWADADVRDIEVVRVPELLGKDYVAQLMNRNQFMVDRARGEMFSDDTGLCVAYPRTAREVRSGTMSTVRRAEKAGLAVIKLPLDDIELEAVA